MPWWMVLYLILYCLMSFGNFAYLIFMKSRILVLFYEIFSCVFLFLMMIAYWDPVLKGHLNLFFIPVFALVLAVDVRITVFGDIPNLGIEVPEEMTEDDIEVAGALSLMFSAPAYILSGLLCLEMIW